MSILVNFLKMPNNCDDCVVSCDCPVDASYDGYKMEGGRPRYCPLIELPEKDNRATCCPQKENAQGA